MIIAPRNVPSTFGPTESLSFTLPSGTATIRLARPQFAAWGTDRRRPADTKGNKPLLEFEGRPSFGELAILATLIGDGWQGRWIDNYPLPPTFRTAYWDDALLKLPRERANVPLPPIQRGHYDAICHQAGDARGGGAWDIIAWRGDEMFFAEAKKRASSDRIREAQLRWLDAALAVGVPSDCFVFIEWDCRQSARQSTRVAPSSTATESSLSDQSHHRIEPSRSGKLHRRTIRAALMRQHGWHVVSRVDGSVDVQQPTPITEGGGFSQEVRRAVEQLGYSPSVSARTDAAGVRWIRVTTDEVVAQRGRGGHST